MADDKDPLDFIGEADKREHWRRAVSSGPTVLVDRPPGVDDVKVDAEAAVVDRAEPGVRFVIPSGIEPWHAEIVIDLDQPLRPNHRYSVTVVGRSLKGRGRVELFLRSGLDRAPHRRRVEWLRASPTTVFLPVVVPGHSSKKEAQLAVHVGLSAAELQIESVRVVEHGPDTPIEDLEWAYPPAPSFEQISPAGHIRKRIKAWRDRSTEEVLDHPDFRDLETVRRLARLYDPATGGFRSIMASLEEPDRYQPDLETSGQAIQILAMAGVLEQLPIALRQRFARFFQDRQDPETGFFTEPNGWPDPVRQRMEARGLMYGTEVLALLGSEPKHPLPGASGHIPAHLASPDAYRSWIDTDIPWVRGWTAGGRFSDQKSTILTLPQPLQQQLIDMSCSALAGVQDPATGDIGFDDGEGAYIMASGAMKYARTHWYFGRPIPNALPLAKRTYQIVLETEPIHDLCWIRNPPTVYKAMARLDQQEPLDWFHAEGRARNFTIASLANLELFRSRDGGWSRTPGRANGNPNGLPLGPHAPGQADMNGTKQAFTVRSELYEVVLGIDAPPIPGAAEAFLDELSRHLSINESPRDR